MRILTAIVIFIISIFAPAVMSAATMARYTLHVATFNNLRVEGACDVELRCNPDSVGFVIISSSAQMYNDMKKVLSDGTLYIAAPVTLPNSDQQKIIIYCPDDMTGISCDRRCRISSDNFETKAQNLVLMGGGNSTLTLNSLKAQDVNVTITGMGRISVRDNSITGHMNCSVTGAGTIELISMTDVALTATLRGTGHINVSGKSCRQASVVVKGKGAIDLGAFDVSRLKAALYGDGSIIYNRRTICTPSGNTANIRTAK